MTEAYLASAVSQEQLAEFHRLMNEEVKEVAVFFMDPDGFINVWNRGAEDMKGYTAEEAIGQHLALLYTDEDKARNWPRHNLAEAKKDGFYREETWRKRKDGRLFWARIALTALRNDSGELVGFSKITMDLTDHKMLERCVKEREQTKRVLRAANAGTWSWHPEKDEIEVSENFLGLLGQSGSERNLQLHQWMRFVHPADRDATAEKFERAREHSPGEPLVMEVRMCPKEGDLRWFYMHADWYREKDDQPYELSGVSVDIQNLKSAEAELRVAFDKLKEADARKDEFLAMLAHELRNPLAPIRAAAEVLRVAPLSEHEVRETSEVIARQAEHMTSLVDDLLDVSRVTRGLVKLKKERLDVRHIVHDAVEQVNPMIGSRSHRLALHLTPLPAIVMGDKKRLVQVIANLLNNAAKFTPEGGRIEVKTQLVDDTVLLSVIDDGVGMEPDVAERVFDLFAQAERTPDRSSGGLGLGLALVKSLVELHGGTVKCCSDGLGKGSRFTVCLPLLADANKDADQGAGDPRSVAPRFALRVLVVDDNQDAAQMLGMLLKASGHEVMIEYGPRKALEVARVERPDVCLLDIGLPEMDGNELARRLKAQPETAGAVLIAVTGYGQEHDRETSLAAGFREHFVKPVDPPKLLAAVAELGAEAVPR